MVELINEIPGFSFEEEIRCGYSISRKVKELWAIELDMLIELDKVCKKIGVKYFFDSGSLLGAVRDGHFIPWDDDIDIVMMRDDYDKFVELANKEFSYPLFLQNPYTEKGYPRGHSQLRNSETTAILYNEFHKRTFNQGIFLDIFALDGIDFNRLEADFSKRNRLMKDFRRMIDPYSGQGWKKYLKPLLVKLLEKRYKDYTEPYRLAERIFGKYVNSEYVEKMMLRKQTDKLYSIKRKWYEDVEYLDFENLKVPVPAKYDEVLKAMYGEDYRIPRNISSLHNLQGDMIIDTEKPYTKYL